MRGKNCVDTLGDSTAISWIKVAIPTMSRVVSGNRARSLKPCPRENRSAEESSWQRRKKQKRRNINRSARPRLAKPRNFTGLSAEAPLERLFLFLPAATNLSTTPPSNLQQSADPPQL